MGAMGANVLVELKMFFLNWGRFFYNLGHFFYNWGHSFKVEDKNDFGIEKISYFGNYMDPWLQVILKDKNVTFAPSSG